MPKLKRPDGRIVSVSAKGVQALLARGYTDPAAPVAAGDDGLDGLSRKDLDARARSAGVEAPEKLPNKGAVIAATRAAESASP
jgi:hypothetical protein